MLIQSVGPGFTLIAKPVYAQEETPIIEISPTQTQITTESITSTSEPTPSETATPEISVAPSITEEPTPTTEPTSSDSPKPTDAEPPHETSPPDPTPTITVETTVEGELQTAIIQNVKAETLNLDSVDLSSATLTTDKPDYAPTDTAIITGNGFKSNHTYALTISSDDLPATSTTVEIKTDENGTFIYAYQLDGIYRPNYKVIVTNNGGQILAETTFTDAPNPSANLDQCANGPITAPDPTPCQSGNEWDNGNLGASKSHYFEGDTVPYRMLIENLALGTHSVTIKWDTTKSDKHATDYITSYNNSVPADPCAGIAGCGSSSTFPIPVDPQVSGGGVTQIPGVFTLYGGTITGVSAYSYPDGSGFTGDKSAQITITFTANQANTVLAWGGHIATRSDWGAGNSAISISGSPYHMRLVDLDGRGGNQDKSLSAEAVIFPASITIIKDSIPNSSDNFTFTASPLPLTDFTLIDDGTNSNTQVFSGITEFTNRGTPIYSVTENQSNGWSLTNIGCTVINPNGGTQTVTNATVDINLQEGENVTCTYTNQQQEAHLIVIKHVVNDNGGTAAASDFTMTINGVTVTGDSSFPGEEAPGTNKIVSPGTYNVTETGVVGYAATYSTDCTGTIAAGQTKTCTVTNDDIGSSLTVTKVVVNDNGGTAVAADFPLFVGATQVTSGVANTFNPGNYVINETNQPGYAATISGDCDPNGNVTLNAGDTKFCTITNNDIAPTLTVIKHVINDNGGSLQASDFTMYINGVIAEGGNEFPGSETGTVKTVTPGAFYIDESRLSGYVATSFSGDCAGTVAIGENKTCTITNNDLPATLHVIKNVINDNGGTKTASDFSFQVNNASEIAFEADGQNDLTVNAGTYSITEPAEAGYATTYSNCSNLVIPNGGEATCTITNNDIQPLLTVTKVVVNNHGGTKTVADFPLYVDAASVTSGVQNGFNTGSYVVSETNQPGYTGVITGDCDANGNITLDLGDVKSCTITNSDSQPLLLVTKIVINDNGGTAVVSDFTLRVGNTTVISGQKNNFDAGNYVISESGPSGYVGTYSGDCDSSGNITLTVGDNLKTCTITNDDAPGTLIVRKVLINDNGGTNQVDDFSFQVNNGAEINFEADGQNDLTVNAGTYNVTETPATGYTTTYNNCSNLVIPNGGSATCTITNDDIAPQLTVIKHVINDNGGQAVAGDFTINVTGTNVSNASFPGDENGTVITLDAGAYNVDETQVAGYAKTLSTDCLGTIAIGETKTCTVTNDDTYSNIIVTKFRDDNGNGTQDQNEITLPNWEMNLASIDQILHQTTGENGQTSFNQLIPGEYTLSETQKTGFKLTGISCIETQQSTTDNGLLINLAPETTLHCLVGNQMINPVLTLTKSVSNVDGSALTDKHSGESVLFTLTVTATQSSVLDVQVTDLPSSGFKYRAGSWSAKKNGVTYSVPEPTYNSPGVWSIGDMNIDDVIELKYIADINNDQQPGLYKDLAWANGEDVLANEVLANSDTGVFVGTAVNVITETQTSSSLDVIHRETVLGGVLGATTELPSTGASIMWIYIALAFMGLGIGATVTARVTKRRKHV